MAVLQDININVYAQPSDKRLRTFLSLSQNENGRLINFRILGSPLPSNCTAVFSGTKPDGNVYSKAGTVAGNFVIVQEDIQMTAVAGVWDAKLDIINGSHNIMTAMIRVMVERGTVAPGSVPSNSQLDGYVAQCKSYAEHARTDAYGSPLTATTAAEMTDKTRVYVYTGSESGMTAGNWYHWNGTAWVSGGVYNAVAVQTDATLSVAGKAADAKKVGDEISAVKEDLVINQPFPEKMQFVVGGIAMSTGKTASSFTNRMRSLYRRVTPNNTYRVEILNSSYYLYYVHFYSEAAETSWLGNPLTIRDNHAVFTAPEGAYYFRIMFYDSADMQKTMTDADVEALANAFDMYQVWHGSPKKERHSEFIRFTVKNNHRWTDNDSTSTDDAESGTETDHLCILTLPTTYSASGKKTPLIMYCHGASCGITDTTWYGNSTGEGDGANFLAMIRRFTAEGYAIFDVDNTRHISSGFNDWGSLPLMSAYIKAWEYVKENYNVESDLYLLSASMGTPVAQNMMKWYKGNIKAALILAPRPFGVKGRWNDVYGTIADDRIKQFLVAWGFEDDAILSDDTFVVPAKKEVFTATVDAKYRGFYHYENMVTIDNVNYVFEKYPPMKVMVGLSDTSFLSEVRAFYAALQNFGNYVNYREVTGKSHGAMCTLVGGGLLDEGVAWFARFRDV